MRLRHFLPLGALFFISASPIPPQGQLDTSFSPAPGTDSTVNVVVPQPDGKVIAAGRFTLANGIARNRIARFNSNGSLDGGFDPGLGPNGDISAAVLQPDGRIVVAGAFTSFNGFPRNRVARLNADGSVDQSFGFSAGLNNTPLCLALQSDGRILIGGQFSQVDISQRFNFARLNSDGTVDSTFDPGIGPNGQVNAIAIDQFGRILIGGNFTGYNGFARGGVARVFGDGTLDPAFDPSVGTGGNVFALVLQHNGEVIIGGRFVQFVGINRTFLARIFSDGSLDQGFNPVPDNWVQSLAVQADDRVLVGGFFTTINGFSRSRIARLNANGSLDFTFDPGSGFFGSLTNDATQVRSLAIQNFGRIVVGGVFTSYAGVTRDNVARLLGGAAAFQNLSTRADVLTGDDVLIAGFTISGTQNKTVLIRALGPSLASFGIAMALPDPFLTVHDHTGAIIATNDNWKDTQQTDIAQTGLAPPNDLDSAILATLAPGAYTAVLEGKGMTTGIGLLEVYDLSLTPDSELTNLSARAFVGTADDVLIGGTSIVGSSGSGQRLLIRALGPSLSGAGIGNLLSDPTLSLRDANGNQIASNDNWKDSQQAEIAATGLAPGNDHESALIVLLPPGTFTAIVAGKHGTTGVALLEFYRLP